jgi:hypothetical protein
MASSDGCPPIQATFIFFGYDVELNEDKTFRHESEGHGMQRQLLLTAFPVAGARP